MPKVFAICPYNTRVVSSQISPALHQKREARGVTRFWGIKTTVLQPISSTFDKGN